MDNEGFQRDVERGAALEMKTTTKGTSTDNRPPKQSNNDQQEYSNNNTTSIQIDSTAIKTTAPSKGKNSANYPKLLNGNNYNSLPSTSCRPEVCQAARKRYAPPELSGSPWHRYKTIFLLLMLILLALWIVIYATLSSLKLL